MPTINQLVLANVLVKATIGQQYGISIIENETIHERIGYFKA